MEPSSDVAGTIWLAATPIGDAQDASLRLRHLLEFADCIAAEDTRRLTNLCRRLEINYSGELLAVHEHNETQRAGELVERAQRGETVLVVSDAGTPTVSDPGFRIAEAAIAAGVHLRPAPGPSAALAALSVSGLPSDRFSFEGFLPRKAGELAERLRRVAEDPRTLIFFESPRRLLATLETMVAIFGGERRAAVCRELTKTHEEVLRGGLAELAEQVGPAPRGEITIVVEGHTGHAVVDADHAEQVRRLAASGMRLKDAAGQVAARTGLRKNELYRAALQAGHQQDSSLS